jgi:glycosyltransferase involved in cell wall biosynthesis
LSSDSEQYPIALLEAMTSAIPVVSTDVGDVKNIVARENRPFIVPRTDEASLAQAIRELTNDAGLREKLGIANRALACALYDEETMFARYRQLYGSAMKRADFARQS